MRIINITEPGLSHSLIIDATLQEAEVEEYSIDDGAPIQLASLLKGGQPNLVVVEVFRSLDFTADVVQHVRTVAPDTPIFLMFHNDGRTNQNLPQPFHANTVARQLGVNDYIDTGEAYDVLTVSSRLLKAAGIEPQFKLTAHGKNRILVGDILFDVIARRAYSSKPSETNDIDDPDADGFQPVSYAIHRSLFTARGAKKRMGEQFDEISNLTQLFELTPEEAKFIEVLSTRQGSAISINDIAEAMYDGVFKPERYFVDRLHSSLLNKIGKFVDNPEDYILFDVSHDGYVLNEHDLSIKPALDLDQKWIAAAAGEDDTIISDDEPTLASVLGEFDAAFQDNRPAKPAVDFTTSLVVGIRKEITDNIIIDTKRGVLNVKGQRSSRIDINDEECRVLEAFYVMEQPTTSLNALKDYIYIGDTKPSTRHVRSIINGLNEKFVQLGLQHDAIQSIKGQGFAFYAHGSDNPMPAPKEA